MRDFAKYLNPGRYYLSLAKLTIPYCQMLFGNTSRDEIKAQFLQQNFAGYSRSELVRKGKEFYLKRVKKCYPSALEWLAQEQRENTKFLILSGSCHPWLQPFADDFGAELICTELAFQNDICSGLIRGKNMTGEVKKEALKFYFLKNSDIAYSIAFGDQNSDAISGALADEYHQNYFH